MKNQFLLFLLISYAFACQSKNEKGFEDVKLQIAIVDSIQVDYLGNLFLFDYNSDVGLYLGRWNSNDDYVLFDDLGAIHHKFKLPTDGPNAINWAMGIGFLDSKFTIMEQQKGLIQFSNDGEIEN